ncbi:hypothetical protein F8R90_23630 [Nostoc sp. NZL]|nr:hypothetical protein [Nostoc sp. NZL]
MLSDDATDAVLYLVERQKLFGLVKTRRKRHRQIDAYTQQIWALSSEVDTNWHCVPLRVM